MKNKQLSRSSQRVRWVPLVAVASLLVVGKSSAEALATGSLTLDWGSFKINDTPVDLFGIEFDRDPGNAGIQGSLGDAGGFGNSRQGLGPVQAFAWSTYPDGNQYEFAGGNFQRSDNKLFINSLTKPSIGSASASVSAFSGASAWYGSTPLGQPGNVSIDYKFIQSVARDALDESASNKLGFKIVISNIGGLGINDDYVVETWTADFSSEAELTGDQMSYISPDSNLSKTIYFNYKNFTSADNPWVPYFTRFGVYAYSDSESTGLLLSAVLSGGLLSRLSLRRLNRRRRSVLALG
jgi:hypothetical protein